MCWIAVNFLQNFEVEGDEGLHPFLTKNVLWKPKVFKLKCAEDTYNEESRIKYTLNSIENVEFVQESQVGAASLSVSFYQLVHSCHSLLALMCASARFPEASCLGRSCVTSRTRAMCRYQAMGNRITGYLTPCDYLTACHEHSSRSRALLCCTPYRHEVL